MNPIAVLAEESQRKALRLTAVAFAALNLLDQVECDSIQGDETCRERAPERHEEWCAVCALAGAVDAWRSGR